LVTTFAVRGNIDAKNQVPDVVMLELMDGERMKLRLLLRHIAVYGSNLQDRGLTRLPV
jgi:hypothetical protein